MTLRRTARREAEPVSRSDVAQLCLIAGALFVAGLALYRRWGDGLWNWDLVDLQVYRHAGASYFRGRAIYEKPHGQLLFTYPPFAAVMFVSVAALGRAIAGIALSAASLLSLGLIVSLCGAKLGMTRYRIAMFVILGLTLEPIVRTLRLGQINLVLTAAVLLDCLVIPARWRGLLTGIVTGMKLTPGIFLLYFLLRRDWQAAARGGLGFAITVAVGVVAAPGASWHYWSTQIYDTSYVGSIVFVDNQSVYGSLARASGSLHPSVVLLALIDAAILLLACRAVRVQLAAGNVVAAVTSVGITGLLISPISWSHHWIWLVPAVMVLVASRRYLSAAVLVVIGYIAPLWYTPYADLRELHHTVTQVALCAAFPAAAILFLVAMTGRAKVSASSRRVVPGRRAWSAG